MIQSYRIPGGLQNKKIEYQKNPVPIVPPDLFELHSLVLFVGARGKGKTHAMVTLALAYKNFGSINRIFIMSPTIKSNKIFDVLNVPEEDLFHNADEAVSEFKTIVNKMEEEVRLYQNYLKYHTAWKKWRRGHALDIHEHTMLENNGFVKKVKFNRPSFLLIIDDMSHTPLYISSTTNKFIKVCLTHRHLFDGIGFTIFMACQTFTTGAPKALRLNIQQFLLWRTEDLTQIEEIWKQIANLVTKEEFIAMFHYATKDNKHDFLLVDHNAKDDLLSFRKNFDTVLIPTNFRSEQKTLNNPNSETKLRKRKRS